MGLSCFRAISGIGLDGLDGWDLCAGLLYEHRFAMLIRLFKIVMSGQFRTLTMCFNGFNDVSDITKDFFRIFPIYFFVLFKELMG